MEIWASVWKYMFFVSITAFGLMSVWVVIQGGFDIVRMLNDLKNNNDTDTSE